MKRMGVLGGIGPQATMDFEMRVHALCQKRIPPSWNGGYPPMVVWYHRHLPIRFADDGRPVVPMQADPRLIEAAAFLGQWADFLVIPCNSAHTALQAIAGAADCPVLSMVDATIAAVVQRRWRTVGVLGFNGAPPLYLDPLCARGITCETIDPEMQPGLDAAIRAVMEGRNGAEDASVAAMAIAALREKGVDGTILGCTEIPLLIGEAASAAASFVNPVAVLAEAAISYALDMSMEIAPVGAYQ
jgi:aspartate racemase